MISKEEVLQHVDQVTAWIKEAGEKPKEEKEVGIEIKTALGSILFQSSKELATALSKFQAEIQAVKKDSIAFEQGSNDYRLTEDGNEIRAWKCIGTFIK